MYWKLHPRWFAALLSRDGLLIPVELGLFPDVDLILLCFGVVTVTTLKPDCASKASFLEISLPLAAVASDADISTRTVPILAILISVNSFFISFL